jgi:hypothetical protein
VDREPMSDLVERVARALFQHADGRLGPWPDLETRDSYWSEAEAALAAIEGEGAKSDFEKNAAILELAARYDAAIDRIEELERANAAIRRVWREVEQHPGIHIRCNGDEAAGVWNRLAQLVEGRNG